jgi:hypothetical protein
MAVKTLVIGQAPIGATSERQTRPQPNSGHTLPKTDGRETAKSHPVVVRAATALRWNPIDDLVGIHNVAGLAMDAVGEVDMKLLCGSALDVFR